MPFTQPAFSKGPRTTCFFPHFSVSPLNRLTSQTSTHPKIWGTWQPWHVMYKFHRLDPTKHLGKPTSGNVHGASAGATGATAGATAATAAGHCGAASKRSSGCEIIHNCPKKSQYPKLSKFQRFPGAMLFSYVFFVFFSMFFELAVSLNLMKSIQIDIFHRHFLPQ